ncbi:MAG: sulfotransferase, partial [Pseudomonadota bacterium]
MGQTLPPTRALTRAKSLVKRGDSEGARLLLIDAARRHPHNTQVQKALVTLDMPVVKGRPPGLDQDVARLAKLCQQGQLQEAIKLGTALLEVLPGDPIVMFTLGAALVEAGRPSDALGLFEAVLRQAPTFAKAWTGYGTALQKMERHHNAVQALNQSLELAPFAPDALNSLATALRGLNRHEEALIHLEEVVRLADSAAARQNYGTTLMELGRREEAVLQLERAIAMAPEQCSAHRTYSLVHRYTAGDRHIAQMDDLAERADLTLDETAHLAFARAKAYDEIDERDKAFAAWREGNRARRDALGYDPSTEVKRFETIARLFRDYALTPLEFAPIPYKPVFVVGMPRSGTSLCEEVLARHPSVWGAGELEDIRLAVARASMANGNRLCHDSVVSIRAQYLNALEQIDAPHGVVTDKMPGNFRFVGFMRLAFPEATIIHMKRDPVAVCWSIYRSYFAIRGHRYAYDLEDVADYYALYAGLMELYDRIWPGAIHTTVY